MKHLTYISFLIFCFLTVNCSTSKLENTKTQKTVKGIVLDTDGFGFSGVEVKIKGTKRKTTTDIDGNFELDAAEGDVLIFNCKNCTHQEINVTDQNEYNITIKAYYVDKKQQRYIKRELRKKGVYVYPD